MNDIILNITVLGQEYKLLKGDEKQYPVLKDANGYVDLYAKKIIIDDTFTSPESNFKSECPDLALNHVYRHEIIHAFFAESGTNYNLSSDEEELIVDWIALQFPKMKKIFEELGVEK